MLREHRTGLLVKVLCGAMLVLLFVSVINMQLDLNKLRETRMELEEQIGELRDDIQETEYRLDEEIDDAYIERYAREVLGYRFPNEILFYNDVAG